MVPATVREKYIIRFCVVAQNSTKDDIGKYFPSYAYDTLKRFCF